MIKLLTIIGARPQIIKAAAISRAIQNGFSDKITEKILHTGQHYDENMSQVFFSELGIPQPDFNLNVGSGRHGTQTAKMMEGVESVLLSEPFDGVVLYGDTNSTLAGAVAASKLHIPIFHIEAGLRSYNMAMPEEVNRIVCDQLSSILFAPTEAAMENLRKEGFDVSPALFADKKKRQIFHSGDVMYDNSLYFAGVSQQKSRILQIHDLAPGRYILATIHRDNNTDSQERLTDIFRALLYLTEREGIKVVLPLHPRTAKLMQVNLEASLLKQIERSGNMVMIPPASFLDMICLEKNAKLVMTDSGGVQKEAFFFEKPCVIFRPETEWVEIIQHRAGILADADFNRIVNAYTTLCVNEVDFPKLYGDAHAAKFILDKISGFLRN